MIVLRQREFARKDYAGLTPEQAEALRAERSKLAQQLKNKWEANLMKYDDAILDNANNFVNKDYIRNGYNISPYYSKNVSIGPVLDGTEGRRSLLNANRDIVGSISEKQYQNLINDSTVRLSTDAINADVTKNSNNRLLINSANMQSDLAKQEILKKAAEEKAERELLEKQAAERVAQEQRLAADRLASEQLANKKGFVKTQLGRVGRLYKGTSRYGKVGQTIAIGGTVGTAVGTAALVKNRKKKKIQR